MPCIRICQTACPVYNRTPSNTCACPPPAADNNGFEELQKIWEAWDLRIMVLFILFTQLYLHFFGRRRRKSMARVLVNVNVWLLYLFSDLLATIALGKLSKVKNDDDHAHDPTERKDVSKVNFHGLPDTNKTMPRMLRGLWAPVILFCLGGPDTMTILRLEENYLWVRHLIGLFTQGLRTLYVLIITFTPNGLSILALLLLIPGIIKYGERVWVIRSRSGGKYQGFIQLDETTINEISNSASQRNANLVLQAYSCFQTLKPHIADYECNRNRLESLVTWFSDSIKNGADNLATGGTVIETSFKLIEIELGLIYDMLFSKVGTVFTVWGSILRSISFSCLVSILVSFFLIVMPLGLRGEVDFLITIMLLVGAIFLEIAGILVQLVSDWVVVWACKYPGRLANLVLRVHEFRISERMRWAGFMGQFSFLNFCEEYKPTRYRKMVQSLCGREKMLSRFGSLSAVQLSVKKLIITQLFEKSQKGSDALQKRGEWSIEKYKCQEFEWSVELEFDRSLVIWHLATNICYHSEYPNVVDTDDMEAANILSNYMMYLLLICPSRFPFCNKYDEFMQDYHIVKELDGGGGSSWSNAKAYENRLEQNIDSRDTTVANQVQNLANGLREKADRWEIMSNVWAEMLCHASSKCPLKHHVAELRHGGEFLTHVWLLLMHFGVGRKVERNSSRKDEYDSVTKTTGACFGEIEGNVMEL